MFFERNKKEDVNMRKHPVVRFASKHLPMTRNFYDGNFFVKLRGRHFMTPLFLVLLIIEFSDVIFAADSIPAIFSVTLDPYIVFFSNIFAILGLRSLFFVLSNVMDKFAYLKIGLSVLLSFIGVKMLLHGIFHINIGTGLSLLIIVGILAVCILVSLFFPPKETNPTY
jgi:tellurite resistance protein TerC